MTSDQATLSQDKATALRMTPVSRETADRLERFVALLLAWNTRTNLIAPSTVPHLWTRHVADSLQLLDLAPATARTWVDLGSGAGFPGMALACALAERPGAVVHLVESNAKKAAFLREAARIAVVPAVIHACRIEQFAMQFSDVADVVTARALAPLKLLFDQSFRMISGGAIGLFPKGRAVEGELTDAAKSWNIKVNLVPSRTDPQARIVVVHGLQRRVNGHAPAQGES